MKRFLLLASLIICSSSLNAASESSQQVERSTEVAEGTSYDLLHKLHIIPSKTYPCIAGKSMSCIYADSPLVYNSISAVCFLVGHDDQRISEEMLQQCKIKSHKLRYLEVQRHFDKIKKKFVSSPLIEESAKNKLLLAAIRYHLTFNGVKKRSQCVVYYEAYDVRTNALIKGQCDLSKNPSFGIFDSEKVQAYEESTELFECYLAEHDVAGFSFCPAELSRFFGERYAVSLERERSRLGRSRSI